MSIEISVLSDIQLTSIVAWQYAIDVEKFPLSLSAQQFEPSGGSLCARLHDRSTTLEYRVEKFAALQAFYKNVDFGREWKYVLALPWINGIDGLVAAWMAATAYARATSGVVFDPQEGKLFSSAQSLQIANDLEQSSPKLDN